MDKLRTKPICLLFTFTFPLQGYDAATFRVQLNNN